jgi:signal transduction histidine kinase
VHAHVSPEAPWVLADAERVGEVLDNLLDNALKYSPPGSKIDIAVQSDTVATPMAEGASMDQRAEGAALRSPSDRDRPRHGDVQFAITDHGIGIPPEERERIFDRFHRVERGDARETYGHGLGLYIARQIIEAHGGTLAVRSRQGEGSTFVFSLPAAPEE